MELLPYIIPILYLVLLESLTVRWIAGGPVPSLVSRIFATNIAGIALLFLVSFSGWFFGWWPDVRNWALRDIFFLFLILKAPIFGFLFRRWGFQRIFTLHVLSNFASVLLMSLLYVYSPRVLGIDVVTIEKLNERARTRLMEVKSAVEAYHVTHAYYPRYLWGGDPASWRMAGTKAPPDPLLKEGYLAAYPVNPLNLNGTYFEPRRSPGWLAFWMGNKSTDFLHVRNLWSPIVESDPRFGYHGAKFGNVLPDPTVPASKIKDGVRFAIQGRWLPGGFFYRSFDLNHDGYPDAYIMGICGDENAQATVDCYDARLDRLTTTFGDQVIPSAYDGIRDGVIFRVHAGFGAERSPHEGEFVPRNLSPQPGEPFALSGGTDDGLSTGVPESVVKTEGIIGK
jgi:hypothetical protein